MDDTMARFRRLFGIDPIPQQDWEIQSDAQAKAATQIGAITNATAPLDIAQQYVQRGISVPAAVLRAIMGQQQTTPTDATLSMLGIERPPDTPLNRTGEMVGGLLSGAAYGLSTGAFNDIADWGVRKVTGNSQASAMGLLGDRPPISAATGGRAKTGGEIGINQAEYKGGQFLPGSEHTVKGAIKYPPRLRRGNKAEVAPYEWLPRPVDGALPLNGSMLDLGKYNFETKTYAPMFKERMKSVEWMSKETGRPIDDLLTEAQRAIDAFNAGGRWRLDDGTILDAAGKIIE